MLNAQGSSILNLVNELNALLNALQIPIPIQSPTDLTPSLLIATLESLLSMRLPSEFSPRRSSSAANIQSMKMFLGVLESDIVKMDVGLSNVDPGRLANGEWEEVVFVGEVLCWVGRRLGVTVDHDESEELQHVAEGNEGSIARIERPYSPTTSAMSITTKKTNTISTFSLHRHTESNTSINFSDYPPDSSTPVQSPRTRRSHPPTLAPLPLSPPHCIHEVPSPSIVLDDAFPELCCHIRPETSIRYRDQTQEPAIRHTGYIEPMDEELELLSFESSYSMYSHKLPTSFHQHNDHKIDYVQLQQSRAQTITLLNERARLLEELAKFKSPKGS